jgi:hypothetical protein
MVSLDVFFIFPVLLRRSSHQGVPIVICLVLGFLIGLFDYFGFRSVLDLDGLGLVLFGLGFGLLPVLLFGLHFWRGAGMLALLVYGIDIERGGRFLELT